MSQGEAQRPMASTAHATQLSTAGACLHVSEMCWAAVQVRHWGTAFPLTISSNLRLLRYKEINLDQLQALKVETARYTELSGLADMNVV